MMRPPRTALLLLCLAVLLPAAPAPALSPPVTEGGPCVCEQARITNGWCGAHMVGYVAGVRVPSAQLYEALDAHGHDIDPDAVRARCPTCRAAIDEDGFCPACGWGFVNGQLYASRLTWLLARADVSEPDGGSCPVCRRNARDAGWCDECGVGRVGPFAWRQWALFRAALAERARLVRAVAESARCETCGVAICMDGRCPRCGITWRYGRRVDETPPGDPARLPPGFLGGWR